MSNPNDPTPQAAAAATPVTPDPAQPTPGTITPTPNGEAPAVTGQAAPVGETFTSVDPNSLPPKDREAYENMLRDYKRKTADIAEVRRKAEAFDTWQQMQRQQTLQQPPGHSVSDEEYARAFDNKDSFAQFLQKVAQTSTQPIAHELQETRKELATTKADLFLKDFKTRHSDFDELDSDGLITGYVQLNPPKTESEWDSRVSEAYSYAKSLRSRWEEAGYKRGLTRVEQKAAQSTELPSGSPAQVYGGGDPTKITAKEAVELAMRGIRVPRS